MELKDSPQSSARFLALGIAYGACHSFAIEPLMHACHLRPRRKNLLEGGKRRKMKKMSLQLQFTRKKLLARFVPNHFEWNSIYQASETPPNAFPHDFWSIRDHQPSAQSRPKGSIWTRPSRRLPILQFYRIRQPEEAPPIGPYQKQKYTLWSEMISPMPWWDVEIQRKPKTCENLPIDSAFH